jgi:hypothetical protein
MAIAKRQKIDSIAGEKAVIQSLTTQVISPETLTKAQRYYFDLLMTSREKATWDIQDLVLACKFAQESVRINELNKIIDDDGLMIDSGTRRITHPALAAVHQSLNQLQSIIRLLGLSANARGISGQFQHARNEAEQKLIAQLESGDDLL